MSIYSSIKPTDKQQKVIGFIKDFLRRYSGSPSFRDIADNFGVSVGTVQGQLNSLQKLGFLTWVPGRARSIKLTSGNPTITQPLPIIGVISAGEGITVFEEPDPEVAEVPSSMIASGSGHYCLRVSGFSMCEDGILDGDTIVVRQRSSASDGETVVAILKNDSDEKATLKRFYHHGNKIELRPRNQQLSSKFYDPEDVVVRGKFCGLIRKEY